MANHSLPVLTSTYTNFVSELDARFDDLALGLDPANTTATNVPTNSIRWSSAGNTWQKWNGSSWVAWTSTLALPGALTVAGDTTLGDFSTDTVSVSGNLGVGGTANVGRAVNITNTALTGTTQSGVYSQFVAGSGATNLVASFVAIPMTADAAFTAGAVAGLYAGNAIRGTASTITNQHGVYIVDQTQATGVGVNQGNFGITSLVSSGTNKWNIYASGTAANYFAGRFLLGSMTAPSSATTTMLNAGSTGAYTQWSRTATTLGGGYVGTDGGNLVLGTHSGAVGAETYTIRMLLNQSGNLRMEADTAATAYTHFIYNANTTTNAYAGLFVGNANSQGTSVGIGAVGTSYTTSGAYRQDGGFIDGGASLSGGLSVLAQTGGMRFYTGGATDASMRLSIGSTGNVGLATESPNFGSHLSGDTRIIGAVGSGADVPATYGALALANNRATPSVSDFLGVVSFSSVNNTGSGSVPTYKAAITANLEGAGGAIGGFGSHLRFYTKADNSASSVLERIRVDSVGTLVLVDTNSNGIKFPASQIANANANTLDDYEEGTFTPTVVGTTLAGAGTYVNQNGFYTKIGNLVKFSLYVEWSAHTGTGNLRVASLPFTSGASTQNVSIANVNASLLTFTGQLSCVIGTSSTQVILQTITTNAARADVPIDTAANIYISGHYFV